MWIFHKLLKPVYGVCLYKAQISGELLQDHWWPHLNKELNLLQVIVNQKIKVTWGDAVDMNTWNLNFFPLIDKNHLFKKNNNK